MCVVSDKLQLCLCAKVDIDSATHYWILHRLVKGKDIEVMGEPVLPYNIDEKADLFNRQLLKRLLNEKAVFDRPIHPKEDDMLELSFLMKEGFGRVTYGFRFRKGQWEEEE